jgi:hypothetical protein
MRRAARRRARDLFIIGELYPAARGSQKEKPRSVELEQTGSPFRGRLDELRPTG